MDLYLHNTLTRKKEKFVSIKKNQVGMYSCGPTVYWYQHIGNLRTYVFSDVLKRVLVFNGFDVKHVMNVTDVGHLVGDGDVGKDKMEEAAIKEHKTAQQIAEYYLDVFKHDLQDMHIIAPNIWCKATEHIEEQIELIKRLEKKGYTYETNDGIYFDSTKFQEYGNLARLNIEGLQKGKRVSSGDKKAKTDFALWKFSEKPGLRQQEWESPWGVGYPGWHIECSAMSMKYLGESFDIHTGGEDHVPVHHTNEIAQSECATGKQFVRYWLHGAFLTFKGEKVSKSKGGLYTLAELEAKGYRAEHYRYLCLLTHYRKPLDFSLEHLDAAKKAFERLYDRYHSLSSAGVKFSTNKKIIASYAKDFNEVVNDDLNMPKAIQIVWKMLDDVEVNEKDKLQLLKEFDRVLGLDLEHFHRKEVSVSLDVEKLLDQREKARKSKDWKLADQLREKIKKEGYDIEDSNSGPRLRKL